MFCYTTGKLIQVHNMVSEFQCTGRAGGTECDHVLLKRSEICGKSHLLSLCWSGEPCFQHVYGTITLIASYVHLM